MLTNALQTPTTMLSQTSVAPEHCCSEWQSMNRIVDINNIGVRHFKQSDFAAAFRCFHQTLLLIHSKMSRNSTSRHFQPGEISMAQGESQRSKALNALLRCHGTAGTVALCSQEHSFTIHDKPFHIPTLESALIESSVQEEWVSAMVIFNCALACHMQGLVKEDGNTPQRRKYLEKARGLYRQALALLQRDLSLQRITGNIMVDLLCIATLNNAALVTMCDLGEYKAADPRRFLDLLITRVHAFKETYCASTDDDDAEASDDTCDTRHKENVKDGDFKVCMQILGNYVEDLVLNAVGLLFAGPPCASAA